MLLLPDFTVISCGGLLSKNSCCSAAEQTEKRFLAFAMPQRKWAQLSLDEDVKVAPFTFNPNTEYVGAITLEADFQTKKKSGGFFVKLGLLLILLILIVLIDLK